MNGAGGEKQKQRWGVFAGILAAFYILHRLRKRRKMKKMIKERARARAMMEEKRKKEEAKKKAGKRVVKKAKKERSLTEQLVRFTIFQLLKKVISAQIKQTEIGLGSGKLGKKLVDTVES
jgi:hypothetical protein